jgi:hypothetical protein
VAVEQRELKEHFLVETQEPEVHKEDKVHKDLLVLEEQQVPKVHKVVLLEVQELKVLKVLQVVKVDKVVEEDKVRRVLKVQQVQQVRQVHQMLDSRKQLNLYRGQSKKLKKLEGLISFGLKMAIILISQKEILDLLLKS